VVGGQAFVVAGAAAVAGDPGQGALDDPAAGQDLEGVQGIGPFDDFDGQVQPGGRPGEQLPGVASVGPGPADAVAGPVQVEQQRAGGVAVLDRCGGDQDFQQQAGGVDGDVAFAAVDLLGVVPARDALGTVGAARTDWESITAAVGSASRPAAMRAWARNASCRAAVAPLAFHRW
jgi:hypothetical protein